MDGSPPTPASRRRELAADALGRGLGRAAAARLAGVSERTVSRWRDDPGFEAVVAAAREVASDPTTRTLREALGATRPDGLPDHDVRVRAARLLRLPAPDGSLPAGLEPAAAHLLIRSGPGWLEAVVEETGEAFRHEL